jgi:hypothetical protein
MARRSADGRDELMLTRDQAAQLRRIIDRAWSVDPDMVLAELKRVGLPHSGETRRVKPGLDIQITYVVRIDDSADLVMPETGQKLSIGPRRYDSAHLMIPEIALKLVPFIVPKKLRDSVTGDLCEDFRDFAEDWGRPYALRWLWWELGGLCIRRLGPTAIAIGIGTWFRQKLGW